MRTLFLILSICAELTLCAQIDKTIATTSNSLELPAELAKLSQEELEAYKVAYSWAAFYQSKWNDASKTGDVTALDIASHEGSLAVDRCKRILKGDWKTMKEEDKHKLALRSTSAQELADDYERNEIAADRKYKNSTVLITGKITSFGRELLGRPYYMLAIRTKSEMFVQVLFSKDDEEDLAKLSKGQVVSAVGICRGRLLGGILVDTPELIEYVRPGYTHYLYIPEIDTTASLSSE